MSSNMCASIATNRDGTRPSAHGWAVHSAASHTVRDVCDVNSDRVHGARGATGGSAGGGGGGWWGGGWR